MIRFEVIFTDVDCCVIEQRPMEAQDIKTLLRVLGDADYELPAGTEQVMVELEELEELD